ncbi:hypothetical protein BT63DRAFT_312943 [Microthyrium microscopicum]|uniref:Adenylyl cyclase-associated protein n=1 Tax=Microthyrium microscopicum TaxID=703497 RepID=A0A6A6U3Y2_9PEZI|nr:hypothetical protein BT63DRAFT_312943 [Microthyrium microscopicum]
MATSNMHNLTTLIKRLEAATSRLEDIATTVDAPEHGTPIANGAPEASSIARSLPAHQYSNDTPRSSTVTAIPPPTPVKEELPTIVEDFDKLLDNELATFITKSGSLNPVLGEQAKEFRGAFEAQRQFLLVTTKAKKPDQMSIDYMDLLKDTQMKMMAVDEVRQKNRDTGDLKEHLSMVADGVAALSWITMESKPADMAAELFGGAQMYGNKILKRYKDKDQKQVEWVQSFYILMRALISYVKQDHPRGIQWNPQGVAASEAMRQVASSSPTTATPPAPTPKTGGGPPPPPPPPPPSALMPNAPGPAKAGDASMGAVFQQLNQGETITSGLKKVDPSQQTHKNPNLRAAAPVPARSNSNGSSKSIPPHTKPKPQSMRTKKPPRKELDGNKWIVENFDNASTPVEIAAEMNHSILISGCKSTTIRITGKGNAITIDNSSKTSLIIDSLVSSVDVIKCPSFALQVIDTLPTILLDQVDGATIYLSKNSLATEVFTSKCSNINVYLPPVKEEDDFAECNVPEQFRSFVKDGKLVTEIVEHKG